MEVWQAIGSAFVALVLSLIAAWGAGAKEFIASWWVRKKREIGGKRHSDMIVRNWQSLELCEEMVKYSSVDRLLLFTGTNCGGKPRPGAPYTVRCSKGWNKDPSKHAEAAYELPLKVDSFYMAMIVEIIEKGIAIQTQATMPENSQLLKYYELEGVLQTRLYKLRLDENELIFISVGKYANPNAVVPPVGFTKSEVTNIELAIDKLRYLYDY